MTRAGKVIQQIVSRLPDQFGVIREIRLFGSYAHGTSTARSDLDFLILTDKVLTDRVMRSRIREAIDSIAWDQKIETDVVFYSDDVYQTDDSRFTNELKKSILLFKR